MAGPVACGACWVRWRPWHQMGAMGRRDAMERAVEEKNFSEWRRRRSRAPGHAAHHCDPAPRTCRSLGARWLGLPPPRVHVLRGELRGSIRPRAAAVGAQQIAGLSGTSSCRAEQRHLCPREEQHPVRPGKNRGRPSLPLPA